MKSNLKRIGIALLLLSLLLVLTSCGGPEATYKSANTLLAKGKYAEAAEKFASLGSYEDAAYLAIYTDACAKGESSDPYVIMDAISIFSNLSGFKDSNMRATYYWGRFCENRGRYFEDANAGDGFQFMEQALEYYESVPLFLDCPTRIKALETEIPPLKESAYNSAIKKAEAGNYEAADELFEKLNNYKDTQTRITYYDIREAEDALTYSTDQDAVVAIAKRYSVLDEFLDCSNREEAMYAKADKIVADKYAQAAALTAEGKCADASAILSKFGKYGNEKVNDCYVVIAEKYIEQRKWDAAYVTYQSAGWGKDANKAYYAKAETLMAEGKWNEASTAFKQIISYKDANERINEPFYKQAEMLLAEGKWAEASKAFEKAGSYKDAKIRINEAYYMQGLDYMEEANWSEAIGFFQKANSYKDSTEQIKVCETAILDSKYDVATALMNEGKYLEAYEDFVSLNGHKDSAAMATVAYQQYKMSELKKVSVGSYITFGTYEQDNITANGKEGIEWLVLAKENNRMLVISRYALDWKPYNMKYNSVTWETCTLRTWLNKDFLNVAFSGAEQAIIPTVMVSADKNPSYNTDPGKATQDKVFLLSSVEANKYFKTDGASQCQPTAYAKAQRTYTDSSTFCWWWLRSPGRDQTDAALVDDDGGVNDYGRSIHNVATAVRPAMWINLEP